MNIDREWIKVNSQSGHAMPPEVSVCVQDSVGEEESVRVHETHDSKRAQPQSASICHIVITLDVYVGRFIVLQTVEEKSVRSDS